MLYQRSILLVAVMAVIAMAAGCGDGGDDSDGSATANVQSGESADSKDSSTDNADQGQSGPISTSSLSKAQFLRRANGSCAKIEPQIQAGIIAYEKENKVGAGKEGEREALAVINGTVLVPAVEDTIDRLWTLGAPNGDEKVIEQFLETKQEELAKLEKSGIVELSEFGESFPRSDELAGKYGLRRCTFSL